MLPYFKFVSFKLGPLTLYVWGIFVALGALIGVWSSERAARKVGLDPEKVTAIAFWAVVAGMVSGRLGHVFFYDPATYIADPLETLRVWHGGMSSLGGLVGGAAVAVVLAYRSRLDRMKLVDALSAGFPLAWAVGRIGCFMIHDHPGILSDGFLSVAYPGGSRYDLGLVESLTGLVCFVSWYVVTRRTSRPGAGTVAVWLPYLVIRFFTDFLRASDLPGSDLRIFGLLTPMQVAIPFVLIALTMFLARRSKTLEERPSLG